jgi:hypothetical protein
MRIKSFEGIFWFANCITPGFKNTVVDLTAVSLLLLKPLEVLFRIWSIADESNAFGLITELIVAVIFGGV